jgi:hypothetical protein
MLLYSTVAVDGLLEDAHDECTSSNLEFYPLFLLYSLYILGYFFFFFF